MSRQIVIYAASNLQQAHLLKNELQRYGIRALVTNETLSRGFGVECPSWGTLPRVIVDEKDATVARQIALSHDKEGAKGIENQLPEPQHFEHAPQAWPRCPECGAPRPTVCPICKTKGTDFPESDPDYAWGFGLEEVEDSQATSGAGCSCGTGGGSCAKPSSDDQSPEASRPSVPHMTGEEEVTHKESDHEDADHDEDHDRPFVLRCTMCDEPFLPEFPNRCSWCGEMFEDGYEVESIHELPTQDSPARIFFTLLGLMLIGGLVIWIFVW